MFLKLSGTVNLVARWVVICPVASRVIAFRPAHLAFPPILVDGVLRVEGIISVLLLAPAPWCGPLNAAIPSGSSP